MKSQPTDSLLRYLCHPYEKANEDLAIGYFRSLFPDFTRQSDASRSDGYVCGHFVLELKSNSSDWYSGLLQGLAYSKQLDFSLIVVAAEGFLGIWRVEDIPEEIREALIKKESAPNKIGKEFARIFKHLKTKILKKAIWSDDQLHGLFVTNKMLALDKIKSFEKTLLACKKIREKITTKNFTKILKRMIEFFDKNHPIKTVSGFYGMIYSWDKSSIVMLSNKNSTRATLNGEQINNLVPDMRFKFKTFVENFYVFLEANENMDDFFAQYDKALDVVDNKFRIQNGIFFTDLDLSKFTMWIVKNSIPDLGKNYIVIDPACGSGNLVTNWKSPLELRHKIVSEIEPELLFAVEKRMQGDKWHNGKFTVVPKVESSKGLNFLDISAEEYVTIINDALNEKGLSFNKPIAFLCNPPYRGDDDISAEKPTYTVHPTIIEHTGEEAKSERYCCFLAQMKLICDHAAESGFPGDSRLILFTKSAWLTNRRTFEIFRNTMFSSFEYMNGALVNGREFFDVKGKFPVAFTIWKYKGKTHSLFKKPILLDDLCWVTKKQLKSLPWDDCAELDKKCEAIIKDSLTIKVSLDDPLRKSIKHTINQSQKGFKRSRRKNENNNLMSGGLPKGDHRFRNKSVYGETNGENIGFMDNLTPCRIKIPATNTPWLYLDTRFMRCKTNRCFSGPPDNRAYNVIDLESAEALFLIFSLAKTFAQIGYPLWADALEIWLPYIPLSLKDKIRKFTFSIAFAENECVETFIPANNPAPGVLEVHSVNPMAPTNPDSFWSTVMSKIFLHADDFLPDKLVQAVNLLYGEWDKKFKNAPQISVSYPAPYFIKHGILRSTAGLVQIKDYAKVNNDTTLLELLLNIQKLLRDTKKEFYDTLIKSDEINYFGNTQIANITNDNVHLQKFDIFEKRLILASIIVAKLHKSKSFGATKFAKVFYVTDMICGQNLKTNYYREAAGPVDYNILYNKNNSVEILARKHNYFNAIHIDNKTHFKLGDNIHEINDKAQLIFGDSILEISRVISLFDSLDTKQSEIIATIYACWNDLIIERENVTDQLIVDEVKKYWHENKIKLSNQRLNKALQWLRDVNLIPRGTKKHTINKFRK